MIGPRGVQPGGLGGWLALACCTAALTSCGDTPTIQQATNTPLTSGHVTINLTGDSSVSIPDPNSDVTFGVDNAHLLVIHLTLRSGASAVETVQVRASLFDKSGTIVGDASGGTLSVKPGTDASFDLSGPPPTGTIDHATFEVKVNPAA
jgi:hypothetical protein